MPILARKKQKSVCCIEIQKASKHEVSTDFFKEIKKE